jgi:Uma2 family endonuclease
MTLEMTRKRFTTDEYEQMGRVGILHEDDRVELIEGEIIQMTAIGPKHAACVNRANMLFTDRFRDLAIVSVQNPVGLTQYSQPQPDVVLLRWQADFYDDSPAVPADVLLLVEVSDSSLQYDRDVKVPLYARVGILEVWLVDLEGAVVLVYRDPTPQGYRTTRTARRGEWITPVVFPGREIAVTALLG